MEKTYTLRSLCADDLVPMMNIVKTIGVKDIRACFATDKIMKLLAEKGSAENVETAIGVDVVADIVQLLVERLPDCKNDVYALLANLSGMKQKDIASLGLGTFGAMVADVIRDPEFKDFFTQLAGLLK